jgi:glycine dehydrogenase
LRSFDIQVVNHPNNFFDTLTIDCHASNFSSADYLISEFHKHDINLRKVDDRHVSISLNETTTITDLADLIEIFAYLRDLSPKIGSYLSDTHFEHIDFAGIPADIARRSEFMTQTIFNTLKSETQLMRYCNKLDSKDYGLTNGMIPLGSCTMKLNSALVMNPITHRGFAEMHPFAPKDQTTGYTYMTKELEKMLS